MWGGSGILGPLFGGLLWAGLLALLVVGGIWLVRQLGRQQQPSLATDTPLNVARRRLAAGEITVEEYDRIIERTYGEDRPAR
jgi:uncharacterized membrane protein